MYRTLTLPFFQSTFCLQPQFLDEKAQAGLLTVTVPLLFPWAMNNAQLTWMESHPPPAYTPYFNSLVSLLTWGYIKVNLDFKVVNSKQVLRYTMLPAVQLVCRALLWIQFSAGRLCCHASNQNAHGMKHGAEIIQLHSCNLGDCIASSQEFIHNWMN